MQILLLSLLGLCLVALVAGWLRNRTLQAKLRRGEISEMPHIRKRPEGCCGKHAVCEKEQLMADALAPDIEYFDDEELDAYKGRASNAYSPDEAAQFEEVMTTMRPDEVAAWLRSLQLRGINLPDELKDEAIMLVEG
ncbi:phospholipase [Prevotellamassilia timonensis]|uniref:phospholipase n=1 Tax=Prevotellamassilia timonensis TaxID=1852370 RepID=UPI0008DA34F4|nr:phospholipase [Prevotellamassilia timonensis]